jgi:SAM-dependent methyltransferase
MDPRQTASNYDQLAAHWAGDAFNHQNGIAQHERALQFAPKSGQAIDVGCGSSGRIIRLLLSRGFEVEGLDLSAGMLALAKAKHPGVTFHHADICTWEFPRRYDFISAWDSIWHVPLPLHPAVLAKLCAALNPGGVLRSDQPLPGPAALPCGARHPAAPAARGPGRLRLPASGIRPAPRIAPLFDCPSGVTLRMRTEGADATSPIFDVAGSRGLPLTFFRRCST